MSRARIKRRMRLNCRLLKKCGAAGKWRCNRGRPGEWRKLRKWPRKPMGSGARVKKLCWHSTFGDICVDEPQYRDGNKRIRPFAQSAEVRHRGCSRPLQRAVTDFGADQSFALAMDKLEEHYGVVLSESTIARITLGHAGKILESLPAQVWPSSAGESRTIIVETDGGMVPIVETDATQGDRRKGKKLCWREAKLSLAHVHGSKTLFFGGTLQGTVDAAGQCLFDCAIQAGFGTATRIHGVGDGAPWIADQVEKKFGAQGSYLIDFYHVCGYLSAAGKALTSTLEEQLAWLDLQKVRLKTQAVKDVFEALQPHIELATIADSDALRSELVIATCSTDRNS